MKSNRLTVMLLIGAILTGGVGWMLASNYINTSVQTYKDDLSAGQQMIKVIAAKTDLKIGDFVSKDTVATMSVPKQFVNSDVFAPSGFAFIEGAQIINPLKRGDALLASHISKGQYSGFASLLEEGHRAITIGVSSLDAISGFLEPGNFIDVLVTITDGDRERTVPLLTRVKVLAAGERINDRLRKDEKMFKEITVGLSLTNATRLVHAQALGDIRILLRSDHTMEDRVNGDYITIDNLVEIKQEIIVEPDIERRFGFEVISGGKS
ncbi:MAG: Flp pilus assembly protein CpaB [Pseudomonadales bacterium]|nr:Flp pilus assembly protein CpaB [Pseudomonadales bacterium]